MQFLTSLLGGSGNIFLTSFALAMVLLLVVLGVWLLKLTGTPAGLRPQSRRLQVVDHMQVDTKRQLLIIRRDNVEHLILTGGLHDLVIESGIPVPERTAAQPRRAAPPQTPARAVEDPPPATAAETAADAAERPDIEQLRQLTRPLAPRRTPSLRQTGLLRPVSVADPAVIPMPPIAGDSASRGHADAPPAGRTAEGNARVAMGGQVAFDEGATDHR